jgi:hypothetical protein
MLTTTYTYLPLDRDKKEIRLFRLQSITPATSHTEAQISGSIEHDSLLDKPSFNALSYVWGAPIFSSTILIDDGTQIPITENLHVALLHVAEVFKAVC